MRLLRSVGVVGLLAALVLGCRSGSGSGSEGGTVTPTTATQQKLSTAQIGQQAGDLYVQALSDVTDLLKAKPEVATARSRVQDLKETYVRKLVELGRAREALDSAGRSAVDSAIRARVDALAKESWYATYGELTQYYFAKDQDFYKLVMSFNIIGQYANFDLLKKQEPGEAKRLGVE